MTKLHKLVFFLIFGLLIAAQPLYAALVASYDQAVIVIKQIDNKTIVATNGNVYEAGSQEILSQAQRFNNRPARILFMSMGNRNIITALKPVNEKPFVIPKPPKPKPKYPK